MFRNIDKFMLLQFYLKAVFNNYNKLNITSDHTLIE